MPKTQARPDHDTIRPGAPLQGYDDESQIIPVYVVCVREIDPTHGGAGQWVRQSGWLRDEDGAREYYAQQAERVQAGEVWAAVLVRIDEVYQYTGSTPEEPRGQVKGRYLEGRIGSQARRRKGYLFRWADGRSSLTPLLESWVLVADQAEDTPFEVAPVESEEEEDATARR